MNQLPTRQQILDWIAQNPDATAKRDIAKAFGVKGAARIDLKRLLKELEGEGVLERRRRHYHDAEKLPPVTVVQLLPPDKDGDIFARPMEWQGAGPMPRILYAALKSDPALAPGDRILARLIETRGEDHDYQARLIRRIGTVSHRVVNGRDRLHVAVRDTGIGISSPQADEIFEHFVQGDNSFTRKAGGTGLGLAISRQLVMLMGGEIAVESVPGQGSTFTFEILAPAAGGAEEATTRTAKGPIKAARPMRLLLAEDNPTNQYVIGAVLRAQGHAVETVPNGVAAVAAAGSGRYDAILMDVHMPEMDGFAAARAIRLLAGKAGQVPIIALTANAMAGDREACLAAGMTDYVSKPVDVATLHAVLARQQVEASSSEHPAA